MLLLLQHGRPLKNIVRVGTLLVTCLGWTQTQPFQFEAATIKPSGVCEGGGTPQPGRLKLRCVTVGALIQMAHGSFANGVSYTPKIVQISGGPGWINSDRYDIEATAEGNPSQAVMRGPMLQALLENRFKLGFHNETREGAVYALTVSKSGVKMPTMAEGSCTPIDLKHPPVPGPVSANFCGTETRKKNGQILTVNVHGISMADLANGLLAELTGKTVIDKTGLDGIFDFHLEYSPDQTDDATRGPSIFTALQEQLGLKLEATKGPVKVFVIDRLEKPSDNY
jgi:uncharacterized protein (TIGR03435 family)